MRLSRLSALLLVGLAMMTPVTCFAYIDPNAGGMLFQLLAPLFAAVVGCWMFLRRWVADVCRRIWTRLTQWVGR
jgi:hypothetical protein